VVSYLIEFIKYYPLKFQKTFLLALIHGNFIKILKIQEGFLFASNPSLFKHNTESHRCNMNIKRNTKIYLNRSRKSQLENVDLG